MLLAAVLPTNAQTREYASVGYYKIQPGKAKEFTEFMTTGPGGKMMAAVAKDPSTTMRNVLQLTMPFATGSEYNFAVVTMYRSEPNLDPDTARWEAAAQKAGFQDWAAYMAKRDSMGTMVRSAIFRVNQRMGAGVVGGYILAAAQKVDMEDMDEVEAYRRQYLIPDAKASIQDGSSTGWMVLTPMFPSGAEMGFSVLTSAYFKDQDALMARMNRGTRTEANFKKIHPDGNFPAWVRANSEYLEHAKLVRTRVWKIVGSVGSMPDRLTASGN